MSANDLTLFGREAELAEIDSFISRVPGGSASIALDGESGIGKTTLCARAIRSAAERGFTVLSARPAEAEGRLSFTALGDLLRPIEDHVLRELPPPQEEALAVALLRRRPTGRSDRRAVGLGLLGILEVLSARAPVLLSIDDAQWLDPSSSRALGFAFRRLTSEPIGVLISTRTDAGDDKAGLPDLPGDIPAHRVHVGPISTEGLEQLIRSRLGTSLGATALQNLHRLSGGNPFFALEILRADERDEPRPTGQTLPIPRSLRDDIVRSHLGSVPEATRELLLIAASVHTPSIELLERVAGFPAIDSVLSPAVDTGIMDREGDRIAFAHPLFAAAVYAECPREQRHDIHRRIADVISDPEERARHLALAAADPDPEIAAVLQSGAERAAARGAPDAAAELYELSIRLTPPNLRRDTRHRMAAAALSWQGAGDMKRAEASMQLFRLSAENTAERVLALTLLADLTALNGDLAEAHRYLLLALDDALGPAEAATLHARVALVCFERGDIENVARHAGPGSADVAPRQKPRRHLDQLRAQALAAACDEDFGRALEILGDPSDLPVTPFELGRTLLLIGGLRRRSGAKRSSREAIESARDAFQRAEAGTWVEIAESEGARIGGRRPLEGELSSAERRVASLVAAGRTNREVADTLYLSVRTVETHLAHIYAKLGVRSRTELTIFFQDDPARTDRQ
jgi:DNA-binding CsgD family transcriptional regulator